MTTAPDLVGEQCAHRTDSDVRCPAPADYLVGDGDVRELSCARHLIDAIEGAVEESSLTVYDHPLAVWRLREDAP